MIVYISGAISNTDGGYVNKFEEAEQRLIKKYGWYVLNPAKLSEEYPGLRENQYFELALHLMSYADTVYMLSDWVLSKGAEIEYQMAQKLGKNIIFENPHDYDR